MFLNLYYFRIKKINQYWKRSLLFKKKKYKNNFTIFLSCFIRILDDFLIGIDVSGADDDNNFLFWSNFSPISSSVSVSVSEAIRISSSSSSSDSIASTLAWFSTPRKVARAGDNSANLDLLLLLLFKIFGLFFNWAFIWNQ